MFPCVYDMDLVANESLDEQENSSNGNFRAESATRVRSVENDQRSRRERVDANRRV